MFRDPNVYEVEASGERIPVERDVFKAWTGVRYMNGEPFHGPVYELLSDAVYQGRRECPCKLCQEHVDPRVRMN